MKNQKEASKSYSLFFYLLFLVGLTCILLSWLLDKAVLGLAGGIISLLLLTMTLIYGFPKDIRGDGRFFTRYIQFIAKHESVIVFSMFGLFLAILLPIVIIRSNLSAIGAITFASFSIIGVGVSIGIGLYLSKHRSVNDD